ncbi:hypothetical protein XAC908_420018 [Xanthomonas citri pv. citri]|nr:hypothetical protein XAC908_420018 [Xanthomonas citri pv. citri]
MGLMYLREMVCWSRGMTRSVNGDVTEGSMMALPSCVAGLPNGYYLTILARRTRRDKSAPFV